MPNADDGLPPSGSALQRTFETLVSILNRRGIRYAIIGGLATIWHTRSRSTDDVDVLLAVPQIAMPGLFEELGENGFDVDLVRNVHELRDEGLTMLRREGVAVDLLRPLIPAYTHVLESAVDTQVLGQTVRVASVEGLIITKLIAMRPQDQVDIRNLLLAYGTALDLGHIRAEIESFTSTDDPRRAIFEQWVREIR